VGVKQQVLGTHDLEWKSRQKAMGGLETEMATNGDGLRANLSHLSNLKRLGHVGALGYYADPVKSATRQKPASTDRPAPKRTTRRFTTETWIAVAFMVAIVVLGWFAYSNNLADGWHFDDFHVINSNQAIQHPSFAAIYKNNNYRQALYWIMAGSWALHGPNLAGWHIENNLIHIANGLLVFGLVYLTLLTPAMRGKSRWPHVVAGLAGAIFVLHPLQTQAVTYITQRTESLCATFYLLALLLYAWARLRRADGLARGDVLYASAPLAAAVAVMILAATFLGLVGKLPAFLVVSALAAVGAAAALVYFSMTKKADGAEAGLFAGAILMTLVACQTKEIAGSIPGAMILWEVLFMSSSGTLKERARAHAAVLPYAAILAVLPVLAYAVGLAARLRLGFEGNESPFDIRDMSPTTYRLTEVNVFATYARMFLLPYGLSLDHDYKPSGGLGDPLTLLSLAALAGAIFVAVKARKKQPVITFAVFFMLGVLAPTSLFVLPDFIFDHRVYLPLAAASFMVAVLAERVVRHLIADEALARKVLVAAFVPVLAVFFVLTRTRNEVWADEETLWNDCNEKCHEAKPRPFTNLGTYYQSTEPQYVILKNGRKLGGRFFDGALEGRPDLWIVKTIFAGMAGAPSTFTVPKADVASGPFDWGGLIKAEQAYEKALAIDADYYRARNNYALCFVQEGVLWVEDEKLAADAYNKYLAAGQGADPKAKQFFAQADACHDKALEAFHKGEAEFLKILERHPNDNVTLNNLGNLYFGYLDRMDDAIARVEGSLKMDESQPILYAVAGEMYNARALRHADKNELAPAVLDFKKAVDYYTRYLERTDSSDRNYSHIIEKKSWAEQSIRKGGQRVQPNVPVGNANPFNNQPGANIGSIQRWDPTKKKLPGAP